MTPLAAGNGVVCGISAPGSVIATRGGMRWGRHEIFMHKTAALSQPAAAAAEAPQISNSWPTYLLIIIASATNTLLLLLIVKLAVWGRQDRPGVE